MNNRSVCTRCGKQRVVVSSYVEEGVTYRETGCSDPECQKIVNKGLASEQVKRDTINKEKVVREEQRLKRRTDNKKSSN